MAARRRRNRHLLVIGPRKGFSIITLTGTKGYRNIKGGGAVSLLIGTRGDDIDHRCKDIRALTVSGVFRQTGFRSP